MHSAGIGATIQCSASFFSRILRSFYITVQQFRMDKCTVPLCGFSAQCSECALRRERARAIVGSGERWLIWICHTAAIERFAFAFAFASATLKCTSQSSTLCNTTIENRKSTLTMNKGAGFNVRTVRKGLAKRDFGRLRQWSQQWQWV